MGYICASVMNCDEGYNERTEQPQARGTILRYISVILDLRET